VELALGSVYVDLEISGVDQLQRTVSPIFFFFFWGRSFALALLELL
jgi:endonuclease YncB( thermonuclease family)